MPSKIPTAASGRLLRIAAMPVASSASRFAGSSYNA